MDRDPSIDGEAGTTADEGAPPEGAVPARGVRWQWLGLAVLAAVVLGGGLYAKFAAAPPGPPEMQTYASHGVTFEYPETLTVGAATELLSGKSIDLLQNTNWADALVLDAENHLLVASQPLPVDAEQLAREYEMAPTFLRSAAEGFLEGLTTGRLTDDPEKATLGSLDGVEIHYLDKSPGFEHLEFKSVFAFGNTEMLIVKCQYSPEREDELLEACDTVLDSFTTSGVEPLPAPSAVDLGSLKKISKPGVSFRYPSALRRLHIPKGKRPGEWAVAVGFNRAEAITVERIHLGRAAPPLRGYADLIRARVIRSIERVGGEIIDSRWTKVGGNRAIEVSGIIDEVVSFRETRILHAREVLVIDCIFINRSEIDSACDMVLKSFKIKTRTRRSRGK